MIIPAVPEHYSVPQKLHGVISNWTIVTWQDYAKCSSTEKLISAQLVNRWDMVHRTVITRKTAKLVALVAIKNNFPDDRSLFSITVHWNGEYTSNNSDAIRVS